MAESPVVTAAVGAAARLPVDQRAGAAPAPPAPRAPGLRLGRQRQANVVGGRSRAFKVKVSEVEGELLTHLAREAGVSVPRLLVEAALASGTGGQTSTQRHEAMVELFAVHRLLTGIAVNINQVARATNASREAPEGRAWVETLEAVRRTATRIDEVIAGLGGEQRAARRRR